MGLSQALDALITKGELVQVHLRYTAEPIGPGKVERITQTTFSNTGSGDMISTIYRMLVPVMMQANPQSKPMKVTLPIVFDGADVVMIYEAPINNEGEKAIVTPGPNGGASGLIIPGRNG